MRTAPLFRIVKASRFVTNYVSPVNIKAMLAEHVEIGVHEGDHVQSTFSIHIPSVGDRTIQVVSEGTGLDGTAWLAALPSRRRSPLPVDQVKHWAAAKFAIAI